MNSKKRTSSKRGHPDKIIFQSMANFKPEHKQVLLQHLKKLMIKINQDEITVEQAATTLDGIAESIYKLKRSYDK